MDRHLRFERKIDREWRYAEFGDVSSGNTYAATLGRGVVDISSAKQDVVFPT